MKYTAFKDLVETVRRSRDLSALAPCYVVFGDDAYLRRSAVGLPKSLLDADYLSFNFSSVSLSEGVESIVETLNTYPVFDELRITVVPDVAEKLSDADKESLVAYLKEPNPAAVLVLVCEEGAEKGLPARCEKVDCNRMDEDSVAGLVAELLREPPSRRMGRAALHELYSRTFGDMSRIACETAKLKAYCDDEITVAAVREMTTPDLDVQIYELSEAVSAKRTEKSLAVMDAFFKDGVKPMTVLGLLYGHYRKMLHVELHKNTPDAALAEMLGVKPGALYHIRRISQNYTQMRLKKCVDFLHGLQFAVLTGKRTETGALHEAVLTLLNM